MEVNAGLFLSLVCPDALRYGGFVGPSSCTVRGAVWLQGYWYFKQFGGGRGVSSPCGTLSARVAPSHAPTWWQTAESKVASARWSEADLHCACFYYWKAGDGVCLVMLSIPKLQVLKMYGVGIPILLDPVDAHI